MRNMWGCTLAGKNPKASVFSNLPKKGEDGVRFEQFADIIKTTPVLVSKNSLPSGQSITRALTERHAATGVIAEKTQLVYDR